jgi:glycosyltransferase involved in cell wall biosynthesis
MKCNYKIDFALITLTGNITRYLLIRPVVESDFSIQSRYYPIRTWYAEDPLRVLPVNLRIRLRHFLDSWRLYAQSRPDAVLMHAFETYYLYALYKKLFAKNVILVNNPDGGIGTSRLYRFAVTQTDLIVPWAEYFKNVIISDHPAYPRDRIRVLHPGIDLCKWKMKDMDISKNSKNILFVGGDIRREGGDVLLDAFEKSLNKTYQLHIATQSGYLDEEMKKRIQDTPNVNLYLDLQSGSSELLDLYKKCDVLIHPTNSDSNSWVALEAMASGVPVIINPMCGISDIVLDGITGLSIPPKNPDAIVEAVHKLFGDDNFRQNIITNARRHVEQNFDVVRNPGILMGWIKELIDEKCNG